MKKIFSLLILAFISFSYLFATDMVIEKKDGTNITIPLNDIDNITFSTMSNLERLVTWMSGSFSSQAQADTSTDPYHHDVRLKMRRIWPHLTGAYWLYVEQAYAETPNQPYRQRIYKVFEENGELKDEIYSIPNASAYIGGYNDPSIFNNLTPQQLILKPNCGLVFEVQGNQFYGHTVGTSCAAGIPGVAYITSESVITATYLTSWDLGYNSNNVVVMGPYSPYRFDKLFSYPLK